MSRAGAVIFTLNGDLIGYGLYNGTCDLMFPWVVDDMHVAWDIYYHDREDQRDSSLTEVELKAIADKAYACRHEGTECVVFSDYGGGFWWPDRCCAECGALMRMNPWEDEPLPGWKTPARGWWPADGHPFPESDSFYSPARANDDTRAASERPADLREVAA